MLTWESAPALVLLGRKGGNDMTVRLVLPESSSSERLAEAIVGHPANAGTGVIAKREGRTLVLEAPERFVVPLDAVAQATGAAGPELERALARVLANRVGVVRRKASGDAELHMGRAFASVAVHAATKERIERLARTLGLSQADVVARALDLLEGNSQA